MKKLTSVCLGCLLFVSACSPHKSTRTQPIELQPQEVSPFVDKTTHYLHEIQAAIQRKLFIEDSYQGKTCDVAIRMSKDGLIYDAQGNGYPPLCKAAMNAIKNADIPAPPDDETYQIINKAIITFKPI